MNKPYILVVEDDPPVQNLIVTMLETQGYTVHLAKTGADAIMEVGCHAPMIVLLDLGLPDLDGIDVIKKIRSWSFVPILVISARAEEEDKIKALDAGADDYITKPFSVEEMLARVRAMQRRNAMLQAGQNETTTIYRNKDLSIDYVSQEATFQNEPVHLSPIEYKLLSLLARNTGKLLTSAYITREIWGSSYDSDLASLRVYMAMLRKKLANEQKDEYIQTRIGVGYRMVRLDAESE